MKTHLRWLHESIKRGPDPETGASITQLTSACVTSHNIYCEERYTSADGKVIALERTPFGGVPELWACDLPEERICKIDEVLGFSYTSNLFSDWIYFTSATRGKDARLIRFNLATFEEEELFSFERCPLPAGSTCSISRDERFLVGGLRIRDNIYGLCRIDLEQGTSEIFHEHEDIFNPHVQFEPSHGQRIMVQLNRGGRMDDAGNIVKSVGEDGATLYLVDCDGEGYHPLPIGKPHTSPITGHECWVSETEQVLATLVDGALELIDPAADTSRTLNRDIGLLHISASADGRFFLGDNMNAPSDGRGDFHQAGVYIGSIETGEVRFLCHSFASCGRSQSTHVHGYLTPDNQHAVFNSDRTGVAQVYTAKIPAGFLDSLESP